MRISIKNFNIEQIAESGQCFRMKPLEGGGYSIIAFGRYLEVSMPKEDILELGCTKKEYEDIWRDYFHIDYDYTSIVNKLRDSSDRFLREAAEYGSGIRILKQEPFEMLISFIISQNKNIPSIKSCIERICESYGEYRRDSTTGKGYYAFPTPEQLALAKQEELRDLKLGYRDNYILGAARAVAKGDIDLNMLIEASHEETVKELCKLHGVGEKVANCVSLYGLHHIEAFPVDVWIKRILKEVYNDCFDLEQYRGYAGIVQQYMFYYIREQWNLKLVKNTN